ncbi:hypothetical protein OGAPHI_001598 [Ogataea philodendri]|uniref:Anaphase-promoting complex subunit 4 WD40 domain-containing protein n=1 Tax=Ogataea philodendri TaxID=1378263 RepID=A0A9P8PDU6_9ASCO|nr:uncharacterized protein OGAPHI_001598 [Ogataea philodendri]KAH3669477.1 hypothetical protein OGAPHI_001598 [Ogataea philodendri]
MAIAYPKEFDTLTLDPPQFRSVLVEWDVDGPRLACARTDRSIKVSRVDHVKQKLEDSIVIGAAHEHPVVCLAWDPRKNGRLVSLSQDATLKVWEIKARTHKLVRSIKLACAAPTRARFSPNGRFLAVTDSLSWLMVLDSASLQLDTAISIRISTQICDLDWDSASQTLVLALASGHVQLFRLQRSNGLYKIELVQSLALSSSQVTSIKYVATKNEILATTQDGNILTIDAQQLVCTASTHNLDDSPTDVDLRLPAAAISYHDNNVRIFDMDAGQELCEVKNSRGALAHAKFHPDTRQVLAFIDGSGRATVLVPKKKTGPARVQQRPAPPRPRVAPMAARPQRGPDRFERPPSKRTKY